VPGWKGLLRATLALLLAPVVWTVVWLVGLLAAAGAGTNIAVVAPGPYPLVQAI
jgi:hypothetical protein